MLPFRGSNADPLKVVGIGTIHLHCFIPGHKDRYLTLLNVSYCPLATNNLISEGKLDKAGLRIVVEGGACTVLTSEGTPIMSGKR